MRLAGLLSGVLGGYTSKDTAIVSALGLTRGLRGERVLCCARVEASSGPLVVFDSDLSA